MDCKLCSKTQTATDLDMAATGICAECRKTLGIIPMPPTKRTLKPCRECSALEFVRVIPREYSAEGGDYVYTRTAPMTASLQHTVQPNLIFRGGTTDRPDVWNGRGILEMYICKGCGHCEWFCLDPETIPIGPEYMTELFGHARTTPHRD